MVKGYDYINGLHRVTPTKGSIMATQKSREILALRLATQHMELKHDQFKIVHRFGDMIDVLIDGVVFTYYVPEFVSAALIDFGLELNPLLEEPRVNLNRADNRIDLDYGSLTVNLAPETAIAVGVAGQSADLMAIVNAVSE